MKKLMTVFICGLFLSALGVNAAAEYNFSAKDTTDYYKSTLYEDVYGSDYNYGGPNVVDYAGGVELPGLFTPTPQGVSAVAAVDVGGYDYAANVEPIGNFTVTAFSPASGLTRADGSIGTLEIPSLGISMKAFEGTTSESMAKGVGHFTDSSGWDGNICLAGHNRGAKYVIGAIKDLKRGDVIRYTTALGVRTYAVTFVRQIANTDWTYLGQTADNRITLITCLADQPAVRVCVQGVEVRECNDKDGKNKGLTARGKCAIF
jgi:sortase A